MIGYGASPGADRTHGPSSSSVAVWIIPHTVSPKCTSLTVAIVASGGPRRRRERAHRCRDELVGGQPVDDERVLGVGRESRDRGEVERTGGGDRVVADDGRRPRRRAR